MNTSNIVPLTIENFQQIVVDESAKQLVLVVFWADQVPESVDFKNKLEAVALSRPTDFLLTTVDCQTQQQIAMQFGIQGLPTAVFLKDSQPVDGIAGPQTDEALNAFLDKHLPKQEDNLLKQAQLLLAEGNLNDAYTVANAAFKANDARADIKLVLADVATQLGKLTDAKALVATIGMVDQDSYYASVLAKIELAEEASNSPEIQELEALLAQDDNNVDVAQKLAAQYVQVSRHEDALALLFSLLNRNRADATIKDSMLDVLKALPEGDALASKYRRKLYTLMY